MLYTFDSFYDVPYFQSGLVFHQGGVNWSSTSLAGKEEKLGKELLAKYREAGSKTVACVLSSLIWARGTCYQFAGWPPLEQSALRFILDGGKGEVATPFQTTVKNRSTYTECDRMETYEGSGQKLV